MKEIKTTAIYGLGALGMLFGAKLQKAYGSDNVKFVMDSSRYMRHKNDKYLINGEVFDFAMQNADEIITPFCRTKKKRRWRALLRAGFVGW